MADSFISKLLRLKEQLGVTTDREVASLLGLTDQGFNSRKSRGSFPEDKLFALAAKRPELGIDAQYVLTGHRTPGQAGARAAEIARLAGELELAHPELQQKLGALAGRVIKQTTVEARRAEAYKSLQGLLNCLDDECFSLVEKLVLRLARDAAHEGKAPDR